jgi:hypothetical protein
MLSVDTPTPFRVSDLRRFISEAMRRLDKPDTSMPYLRLKSRLESLGHPLHSAYVAKNEAAAAWSAEKRNYGIREETHGIADY